MAVGSTTCFNFTLEGGATNSKRSCSCGIKSSVLAAAIKTFYGICLPAATACQPASGCCSCGCICGCQLKFTPAQPAKPGRACLPPTVHATSCLLPPCWFCFFVCHLLGLCCDCCFHHVPKGSITRRILMVLQQLPPLSLVFFGSLHG